MTECKGDFKFGGICECGMPMVIEGFHIDIEAIKDLLEKHKRGELHDRPSDRQAEEVADMEKDTVSAELNETRGVSVDRASEGERTDDTTAEPDSPKPDNKP